ncbi:hypothetical protein M8J77_006690 [Diaphorina citri]|nr:hypothetical protein M8J77_006690 [Diaphorina citri]
MGQAISHHYNLYFHPEVTPYPPNGLQFDPNFGFAEERPVKVMKATPEELASCHIPQNKRDYCAHKLIDYKKCVNDNLPWIAFCEHEKHDYETCLYNEYVDTYKDYERERRLLVRQQRILKKKAKEELIE